jgi:amino acid adenylation domain-containing protein
VVLTSSTCRTQLPGSYTVNFVTIDTSWPLIAVESSLAPGIKIAPNQLAYVIYTSGSTGKPKGVLIEHRNVVRLFKTDSPLFDFNESDVWTVFHSFCFDFSVWEMYGALFYGGRMVIVPGEIAKDLRQFAELLQAEKVTVLNQTPSSFYVLQEVLAEKTLAIFVRYVIFGGEALNPSKLQPWMQMYPNCKLVNMYGITETTVHVTYQLIDRQLALGSKSIIGKPIPTLGAYILDASQQPVPIGVPGELYITGAGLARGYLNRPELTAVKFLPDPFSDMSNARMYRTGDLGRWLPDGSIEYLGRIDEQVKIRGYRIELGEIETVLQKSELVSKSVVIANQDKEGNKRLVAYVVPKNNFSKEKAMAYLKVSLPEYMVPALWVELGEIPLTANGKIDRKALPVPDATGLLNHQFVAPRNELEINLALIWKGILAIDRVGVHDNFFELGGHSLLLMRLMTSIKKAFGVTLTIRTFFELETLEELANYIRLSQRNAQAKSEDYESIEL